MSEVIVTDQQLEPESILAGIRRGNPRVGAVVTFLGLMRDLNDGDKVASLYLEHYPGMTEKALRDIVNEAKSRWNLEAIQVVHRVGEMRPEEPIVLVAAASRHRGEAFRACEFVIDYLKNRAPFWKKETTAAGERWVDARASDRESEARWQDD